MEKKNSVSEDLLRSIKNYLEDNLVEYNKDMLNKIEITGDKITKWELIECEAPSEKQLEEFSQYSSYKRNENYKRDRFYYMLMGLRERLGMSEEEMTDYLSKFYDS